MIKSSINNYHRYNNIHSELKHGNLDKLKNPYITIVIPTFKRVNLLKDAIDSALNQVNPEVIFEVIIVDNEASINETETEKLLKTYNTDNIFYYRNKRNIGMFGNWNRCIELARGEWVSFLHDDDLLNVNYINTISKLLKKKKNMCALISDFTILGEDNFNFSNIKEKKNIFKSIITSLEKNKLMRIRKLDSQVSGNIYNAPTCGSIFKRDILLKTKGFDEDLFPSADWFFFYNLNSRYSIYRTRAKLGYYRLSENESLNPDTCKAFLLQSIEFRRFLALNSFSGKILEFFFSNERYFQTLEWVKKYDVYKMIDFDQITREYGYKHRRFRSLIFFYLQKVYWALKRIITIIFG